MADNKETHIGNSKLKNSPEKQLKVVLGEQVVKSKNIADGAVTKGKLGNKSVEVKNLDNDVLNLIASMEKGGVALSSEFGDSELIGINQKKLTEVIGPEGTLQENINTEVQRAEEVEETLSDRVSNLETTVGEGGSIDERIATVKNEIVGNASENYNTLEKLEALYLSLTQSDIEVVSELPETGEAHKIYRLIGESSYADYMYNVDDLTTPIKMAEYSNATDNVPIEGSNNFVRSGGVYSAIDSTIPKIVYSENAIISIDPNKLYIFNGLESISITFNEVENNFLNEYMIQFTCPNNVGTTLYLPSDVKWSNDTNIEPVAGSTYQVSIVNNLAVYAEWENN